MRKESSPQRLSLGSAGTCLLSQPPRSLWRPQGDRALDLPAPTRLCVSYWGMGPPAQTFPGSYGPAVSWEEQRPSCLCREPVPSLGPSAAWHHSHSYWPHDRSPHPQPATPPLAATSSRPCSVPVDHPGHHTAGPWAHVASLCWHHHHPHTTGQQPPSRLDRPQRPTFRAPASVCRGNPR